MKKLLAIIIIFFTTTAASNAGEYATALSNCLTKNTSVEDKAVMARWVFTTLSQHPAITSMSTLSEDVTMSADRDMARLVEKFMYEKCKIQVKDALQNEGPKAIELSIRNYAQNTGQDILRDPSITNNVTNLAQHLDLMKLFQALTTN